MLSKLNLFIISVLLLGLLILLISKSCVESDPERTQAMKEDAAQSCYSGECDKFLEFCEVKSKDSACVSYTAQATKDCLSGSEYGCHRIERFCHTNHDGYSCYHVAVALGRKGSGKERDTAYISPENKEDLINSYVRSACRYSYGPACQYLEKQMRYLQKLRNQ